MTVAGTAIFCDGRFHAVVGLHSGLSNADQAERARRRDRLSNEEHNHRRATDYLRRRFFSDVRYLEKASRRTYLEQARVLIETKWLGSGMSEPLQYQIRLNLNERSAEAAREDADNSLLVPLMEILRGHGATLVNQLDAFEGYLAHAEKNGVENFPLYRWTKAVVEDPDKRKKHLRSFTLHVADHEVYDKEIADALEAALLPLVGGDLITALSKHDTNPKNNPQMPAEYRS
jgi:hypothetical protein